MDHSFIFLSIAIVLCFLMTWGVGANDLANVMSTTMGSKAVSVKQAMLIAIIFEFAGAFLGVMASLKPCAMALSIRANSQMNL